MVEYEASFPEAKVRLCVWVVGALEAAIGIDRRVEDAQLVRGSWSLEVMVVLKRARRGIMAPRVLMDGLGRSQRGAADAAGALLLLMPSS